MSLTLVSSLDVFSRQKACAALAAEQPGALVVFHDLLEGGLVVRRVFQEGVRLVHGESTLEHPCLGCTVRLDADVIAWLKSKGEGYQTRLNAMLRQMMERDA